MRIFGENIPVKKIIDLYNEGNSSRKVAKLANSNQRTVLDVLCEFGIKRRGCYRKNFFDENYFEKIDSPDKAYFLGLMYADGNNYPESGLIQISLEEKDKYILEKFKERIKLTDTLKKIEVSGETRQNITTRNRAWLFRIVSKKLSEQLNKLGVVKAKSLILKFPTEEQVPKHLLSHFIRGFFDGDGCISVGKNKKSIVFGLISTFEFLEEIQKVLMEQCNLNKTKIYHRKNYKNTYTLYYTGYYLCQRIYEYLYKDCEDLFLTRKKEKFFEFIPQRAERKTSEKYKNKNLKTKSLI